MEPAENDPFEHLPPELRNMMEQLGGGRDMFAQLQSMLFGGGATTGPVNWDLARRVAFQLAADGDRNPTEDEVAAAAESFLLAEHWLDEGSLPAPMDGGTVHVVRRGGWVDAALTAMRPVVEPVAAASTRAITQVMADQMPEGGIEEAVPGLPPQFAAMLGGMDLSAMLQPLGATLAGMQVGQIVGQLSRQLMGQYELGIPTAPRSQAIQIAVNVDEVFDGWDLDPREVGVALALHEAANRRLFHAVPWLEAHVHGLVAQFANGTRVDVDQLQGMAEELMTGVDPEDPEQLQEAMQRAADFRMQPTEAQRRVLDRLQGVVCLVQAWVRHEVAQAAEHRLSGLARIDEILRRRRAEQGDGEALLAQLLGLDLRPEDETIGDDFIAAVTAGRGSEGLQDALAHPENLPDREELADPSRWLVRMAAGDAIPDDPASLFAGLGEAPREASAEERARDQSTGEDEDDDGDDAPGA